MINIRRRKNYKSKNYNNPYFQKRRKNFNINFSWNLKSKLVLFFIFIFIIILFYGVFYSPLFKIKYINISGNNRVSQDDLLDIAWQQIRIKKFFIFPQNNLFLCSRGNLAEALENKFSFENINVDKKFFHTLNIDVQEKSYAFIWIENEIYYYSDIEGYIIKEISPLDIKEKKYPIIDNIQTVKIKDKKIEIDKDLLYFAIDIYNQLSSKSEEYKIDKFILFEERSLKLKLIDGPEIIFNYTNEASDQLNKLDILREEKLKNDFYSKEYIDLRFGDRVYYR